MLADGRSNAFDLERQHRLLAEAVTEYSICTLDPKGIVTSWNSGARRMTGYAPAEILGQHISRMFTYEDRQRDVPSLALKTAAREGEFQYEGWRVRKDGTRFWACDVFYPIRERPGDIIGFGNFTRDLTKQKATEAAVAATIAQDVLERRETKQELDEAREALLQSQKMEAVGHLTGGIAHDFNNLLMAVLGSLELMRKRLPDDSKLIALLENAIQGAQRGAALTKRLLAFARRQELKQEAIDIPKLVRAMQELLERSLGPSIKIETQFPSISRPVLCDANQLEMILLNLAVNARDAMPTGGQILIAAREEVLREEDDSRLHPGAYLCLTVSDTGSGMDEETLRHAMEPFFTTKGPGKGTGLGLSVVHGIVEQCGGWFTLRSRKGEGTTAELWLPLAPSYAPKTEIAANPSPNIIPHYPLVILTVDDDELVLANTIAMLEDLGHTGLAASSGSEGLGVLRRQQVDLVITDYAMPHMDGRQLAAAIKKEWPDLPIIVASGFAEMSPETEQSLCLLPKPFSEGELAMQIARVLEKKEDQKGSRVGDRPIRPE